MANKTVPVILMVSGASVLALGIGLLWYGCHRDNVAAAQAQAKAQQAQSSSTQPGGGKIPLTVFADEGVPLEATRT